MEDTQTNGKSKLEMSKKRLAKAFNSLEAILEENRLIHAECLKTTQHKNEELEDLQKKLLFISGENKKLVQNLQQLGQEYSSLKTLNIQALRDLEDSIYNIESLLKTEQLLQPEEN
ncbi:hypothetical protein NOVO_06860 [Rickettsiales bacterium Ac37b]|nr:hypothetical protein NOVO_06860 [Rickettsiales bacterium Ac37b]